MSAAWKCLVQPQFLPTTAAALHTASGDTVIDKCRVTNTSAAPVTVTLYVVQSGNVPATVSTAAVVTLEANEVLLCAELVGELLKSGDAIGGGASVANVASIRVSGRTFT